MILRFVANNLDAVFICANRTIGTQAEKHGAYNIIRFDIQRSANIEAGICDIVDNANGKIIFRLPGF